MSSSTSTAACVAADSDPVATVVPRPLVLRKAEKLMVVPQTKDYAAGYATQITVMGATPEEVAAAADNAVGLAATVATLSQQVAELKAALEAKPTRTRKPKAAATGGASASGGAGDAESVSGSSKGSKSWNASNDAWTEDDCRAFYWEHETLDADWAKHARWGKTARNRCIFARWLMNLEYTDGGESGKISVPGTTKLSMVEDFITKNFPSMRAGGVRGTRAAGKGKIVKVPEADDE